MNLAVLRRESSGLIFGFVQSTGSFLPELPVLGQLVTFMLLSKHHTFSEVKSQNNQILKHVSFPMIELPGLSAASLELEELYHILRLLKRPRHSAFVMQITCFSTSSRCFASHNQHHLIATMKHYSVHLPSSKKRNNNRIKPNKLIFLLSCRSLSQQKVKEHVPGTRWA